jgi:hypothetical protein
MKKDPISGASDVDEAALTEEAMDEKAVATKVAAKKVAVIAVHGISDQKPFESARAIADLLLNYTDSTQSQYKHFQEKFLRIGVEPLKARAIIETEPIPNKGIVRKWSKRLSRRVIVRILNLLQSPDERGVYMSQLMMGRFKNPTAPISEPSYVFMRDQVSAYKQKSVYESICLEGEVRNAEDPTLPPTQVHVYEMYWADLSRLGSGFVRIFGELYQLLFHLGSLGRQSIDLTRIENQNTDTAINIWALYSDAQAWTVRFLNLFFPILNLFLLVAALMSLPSHVPELYANWVAAGSTLFFAVLGIGYLRLEYRKAGWIQGLMLCLLAGIGGAFALKSITDGSPWPVLFAYQWLAVEWSVLIGTIIVFLLIRPYGRHRPGATRFAIAVGIPISAIAIWVLWTMPNSPEGITFASLRMIEIIYSILLWGWFFFLGFYFATLLIGVIAIGFNISKQTQGFLQSSSAVRRRRAIRTAMVAALSVALPTLLFSLLTLSLWAAFARVATPLLPTTAIYKPLWFFKTVQPLFAPADFIHALTVFSGSNQALTIIFCTLLATVIVLGAMVPEVLTEVFPPKAKHHNNNFSEGLGRWLNFGFWMMFQVAGGIIVCSVIPVLILWGTINGLLFLYGWITPVPTVVDFWSMENLLNLAAVFLTASATSLIAFGERLDKLSIGFRGVLDAILDVDNYLRLHPVDDNPSARIYARYVSLLRYLCSTDLENQQPYDGFVIVAHSQGTVITADLLQFLKLDPDPALTRLQEHRSIHLFTMGSPLRQLYGFGFPHLYHWAINETTKAPQTMDLSPTLKPLPDALLGVKTWTNAFRSGDYVGRYLWRHDQMLNQWNRLDLPDPWNLRDLKGKTTYLSGDSDSDELVTRREFCLGAGAHTHYWDSTAPEVAKMIDDLIRRV